jgi:hypothetical protein
MCVPLEAATSNLNPAIRSLQQNVYKSGGLKGTTHFYIYSGGIKIPSLCLDCD